MLPKSDASYSSRWPAGNVGTTLRYPKDGIEADTDWVQFNFYKYTPPFSSQGFDGGGQLGNYNQSASGLSREGPTIQLYMPEDIGVKYGANWGDKNISNFGRGMLGGAGKSFAVSEAGNVLSAVASGIGTVLSSETERAQNFLTKGTGTIKAIQEALSATGFDPSISYDDILGGITGQILNPNTEVLYTGPQMRGFGLSFKMAPRNQGEADQIRDIISSFKYAILPKFNGDSSQIRAFVGVPNIVDVTFMTGGRINEHVTQYKPCAITGFDVSYTPDGAWATYANGRPVATTISIEFKELKMVYAEEISKTGGSY